jgi:hypothetical protein
MSLRWGRVVLGFAVSLGVLGGCLDVSSVDKDTGPGDAGTGAAGTGGIASDSGWGLEPLPCDPRFSLSDNPVVVGTDLVVSFTDSVPYTNIDLAVDGAGPPSYIDGSWTSPKPSCAKCTWSWGFNGQGEGKLYMTITADQLTGSAECQVHSVKPNADAGADGS